MADSSPSLEIKSIPLAFFGTADFSVPSLRALLESGYKVSLVVARPDKSGGRGQKLQASPVKTLAAASRIPVIQPGSRAELESGLSGYEHIKYGVVAAYGMIIPKSVLDRFDGGLINIHASLLPRWRGPSPIEAAILAGDTYTGISVMRIAEVMDAGPVYGFAPIELAPDTNQFRAHELLSRLGADTLTALLPGILAGDISPIPQDETTATYCGLIKKTDGRIDWKQPAERIEHQIRAYLKWPGSTTEIAGKQLIITAAKIINQSGSPGDHFITDTGDLAVYCKRKALLIKLLIPAGRREMTGSDFVKGYIRYR